MGGCSPAVHGWPAWPADYECPVYGAAGMKSAAGRPGQSLSTSTSTSTVRRGALLHSWLKDGPHAHPCVIGGD